MDKHNGRIAQEVERLSIFELGGKLFGLNILKSREVIPLPRFTPLPNCEEIYFGVFNLRGEIFPLVDVSPILGMTPKNIDPEDMVILVDASQGFPFGMLVDNIHSVLPYLPGEIKSPRGMVSKVMEPYIAGLLHNKQNIIYILDIERIFQAKKLLAHF